MQLTDILNGIYPLPHTSMKKIAQCASELRFPKGHCLLEAGKTETNLFLIAEGIIRGYILDDGKEVTFWIGKEGDAVVSLKSYVKDEPGYEYMQLMEDARLFRLNRDDMFRLYEEDIHIANWGRKMAEREFLKTEEKLIPMLFTTAEYRYRLLLENHTDLLQRIPLEHLASYLGITPVSLSRIRSRIRK